MTHPRLCTTVAALLTLSLGLGAHPPSVRAQAAVVTIDDLAAAQRSALEAEARRALERALDRTPDRGSDRPSDRNAPGGTATSGSGGSSGLAAQPIPLVPAVRPATAAATPGPAPATTRATPAPEARLQVAGAARTRSGWRVEITTDAGTWWLAAGQPVPGTAWRVAEISTADVVLVRPSEALTPAASKQAGGDRAAERRSAAAQRAQPTGPSEPPEQRRRFTLPAPQPSPQAQS